MSHFTNLIHTLFIFIRTVCMYRNGCEIVLFWVHDKLLDNLIFTFSVFWIAGNLTCVKKSRIENTFPFLFMVTHTHKHPLWFDNFLLLYRYMKQYNVKTRFNDPKTKTSFSTNHKYIFRTLMNVIFVVLKTKFLDMLIFPQNTKISRNEV